MSERKMVTDSLSNLLISWLRHGRPAYLCMAREVTFDYGTPAHRRVDYMTFEPRNASPGGIENGDVTCYEIKSSKEDFESANGHNLFGDFNYYVMTENTYEQVGSRIAHKCGVICSCSGGLRMIRKASRVDRKKPLTEVLLMMFRSANRDAIKIYKTKAESPSLPSLLWKHLNPKNDPRIYISRGVLRVEGNGAAVLIRVVPLNNSVSGIEKSTVYCYFIISRLSEIECIAGVEPLGDYNYYVAGTEVHSIINEKGDERFGIICPWDTGLKNKRKAKRMERKTALCTILFKMFFLASADAYMQV